MTALTRFASVVLFVFTSSCSPNYHNITVSIRVEDCNASRIIPKAKIIGENWIYSYDTYDSHAERIKAYTNNNGETKILLEQSEAFNITISAPECDTVTLGHRVRNSNPSINICLPCNNN